MITFPAKLVNWAAAGFFVAAIVTLLFHFILKSGIKTPGFLTESFFGAFFAFLFVKFGEILSKFGERKRKNQNALVRIEHLCNEYLQNISDNILTIQDFLAVHQDILRLRGTLYPNILSKLPFDRDWCLELTNLKFLNEFFSFGLRVGRINKDIEYFNALHLEIKDCYIEQRFEYAIYKANVEQLAAHFKKLETQLLVIFENTKVVLATTRHLLKNKAVLHRLFVFMSDSRHAYSDFEIQNEYKVLELELQGFLSRFSSTKTPADSPGTRPATPAAARPS